LEYKYLWITIPNFNKYAIVTYRLEIYFLRTDENAIKGSEYTLTFHYTPNGFCGVCNRGSDYIYVYPTCYYDNVTGPPTYWVRIGRSDNYFFSFLQNDRIHVNLKEISTNAEFGDFLPTWYLTNGRSNVIIQTFQGIELSDESAVGKLYPIGSQFIWPKFNTIDVFFLNVSKVSDSGTLEIWKREDLPPEARVDPATESTLPPPSESDVNGDIEILPDYSV
jgi:hypothetical protein